MNILIPNAPGKRNLGDQAIFEQLIKQLKEEQNSVRIVAHVFNPRRYLGAKGFVVRPNIYYWAVFQKRTLINRVKRLLFVLIALLLPQPFDSLVCAKLDQILRDYRKADRIVFEGGGYFRSQPGLTQQINALMNGLPLLIGKKYGKTMVIRPMSFGPFSNKITEWLCAKVLNLAETIHMRDDLSYELLGKYLAKTKLIRSADDALLIKPLLIKKSNQRVLGFTVREWVKEADRDLFIKQYSSLVAKKVRQQRCTVVQPIIQVDAPEYNEGDQKITNDVRNVLKSFGLTVQSPIRPKTVRSALTAYGKLSYLVGMRMHSCIFAHVQRVPLTAVSYEHKHDLLERKGYEVIPVEHFLAHIAPVNFRLSNTKGVA